MPKYLRFAEHGYAERYHPSMGRGQAAKLVASGVALIQVAERPASLALVLDEAEPDGFRAMTGGEIAAYEAAAEVARQAAKPQDLQDIETSLVQELTGIGMAPGDPVETLLPVIEAAIDAQGLTGVKTALRLVAKTVALGIRGGTWGDVVDHSAE